MRANAGTQPASSTGLAISAALLCAVSPAAAQEVRVYGDLDYLLWWVKGAPLSVPLVSTGPESNFNRFLFNSKTTILYGAPHPPATGGNGVQDFKRFSGGRLTLGYTLDPSSTPRA